MRRFTKIIATVGPQRESGEDNPTRELGSFDSDGRIPHGSLVKAFIDAGADIIRINMAFASKSHPYGRDEAEYLDWLTRNKDRLARDFALLGDLPGPKVRLGAVSPGDSPYLKTGDSFFLGFGRKAVGAPGALVLVNDQPFHDSVEGVNGHEDIGESIRSDQEPLRISIGDGKVEMRAIRALEGGIVECEVLSEHASWDDIKATKGLTLKHTTLDVDAFQQADVEALDFLLEHGKDVLAFVAVSFVQDKHDILKVKYHIETSDIIKDYIERQREAGRPPTARTAAPGVIAKIETIRAWDNIDQILDVADGVMVARGDLGEQLPPAEVPKIQKELIRKCNARGKPVITATQMLDSMEKRTTPTRAEATDVFNAILDGTDAVMLSGETAIGRYPVSAIRQMADIAERAEDYYFMPAHRRTFDDLLEASRHEVAGITQRLEGGLARVNEEARGPDDAGGYQRWMAGLYRESVRCGLTQSTTDRICEAACALAEVDRYRPERAGTNAVHQGSGDCKSIVVPTTSGRTAFMISRFRPAGLVIGAAHYERTFRKLIFAFGVRPIIIGAKSDKGHDVLQDAVRACLKEGLLSESEEFVYTAGTPLYVSGTTNLVHIHRVGGDEI